MKIFNRTELKDINDTDLQLILKWRNQDWIRKVMYNSDQILIDQHIQWYKNLQQSDTTISKIFYYDDVPHGILNIAKIDRINNKCEWGFYIGVNNSPKGMGTLLGFTSLNYIFYNLSFRKVSAEVLSSNGKSIYFHQMLGFIQEGKLRKHILKDNSYVDVFLFGLFKEEWEDNVVRIYRKIEGMNI